MKVIVSINTEEVYDISTPEKERAAYLIIFNWLDRYYHCYDELTDPQWEEWYQEAKLGFLPSIKKLIAARKDFTYEKTFESEIHDPLVITEQIRLKERDRLIEEEERNKNPRGN